MADRYYVNSPLGPGRVVLTGPEAHHLATVCRARPGDAVCLFNGDGADYPAMIAEVGKKNVALDIQECQAVSRELPCRLEVAAPLPKADRADFLIEKLTELGVTRFVPLRTERSVVHPRGTKIDRLERAVIEASKQCGRNVLMQIGPLTDWSDYLRADGLPAQRWLAHPGGESTANTVGDRIVAVGPEGGFTDAEVGAAVAAGWRVVGLGPRVLRVETAAMVMAVALGG